MAWSNPATWGFVDRFQDSLKSVSSPQPGKTAGNTGYGGFSSTPSYPQQTLGASTTVAQSPQQTGANDAPATGGSTYDPNAAARAAAEAQRVANMNLVNSQFDTQIAGLQSQLGTVGAQEGFNNRQITNQYDTRSARLNQDVNTGRTNLDRSQNKITDSRLRGLKSIADQLRQQGMSYNNQLGAMGAGDSSASQLVNFALGNQAGKNRYDVVRNASDQEVAVQDQRKQLETDFQRNMQDLDTWKAQSLQDVALKYAEIRNQIQNQMATANVQRQQQLAQYDASATQAAINELGRIQGMYAQQAADLNNRYNAMSPQSTINVNQGLLNYDVKPIDEGVLASVGLPASVNPEAQVTAVRKRPEDQVA